MLVFLYDFGGLARYSQCRQSQIVVYAFKKRRQTFYCCHLYLAGIVLWPLCAGTRLSLSDAGQKTGVSRKVDLV